MKTLVVVLWLAGGPWVSVSQLNGETRCRAAMEPTASMLREQARSNLSGAHLPLQASIEEAPHGQIVIRMARTGRELARLRCT